MLAVRSHKEKLLLSRVTMDQCAFGPPVRKFGVEQLSKHLSRR